MPTPIPDPADIAARLDRIQQLVDELVRVQGDTMKLLVLSDNIRNEIENAKLALRPIRLL